MKKSKKNTEEINIETIWWQIMHTIMPRSNPSLFWDADFYLRILYARERFRMVKLFMEFI